MARFLSFEPTRLSDVLQIREPRLARRDRPHKQLDYVEDYVRAAQIGCRSIAIEDRYIDRDYMEDYSVFYSKSVHGYKNYCRRVHFFRLSAEAVEQRLAELRLIAMEQGVDAYRQGCAEFSEESYIGFSVIKPLDGCPVGRTVLRCFPENATNGEIRRFSCTRIYKAHLAGVELSVRGLAFQQQDLGVSACATTALWTAFHKMVDFENIALPTPASITALAARYSLPHGRAMPSEGLSIDQMCQAIQGVGLSPNLFRADRFDIARGYLHSACNSGNPAVLIIETPTSSSRHAITVTGMRVRSSHVPALIAPGFDDLAGDLISLYVHDDRYGTYLRANLVNDGGRAQLNIRLSRPPAVDKWELWKLTHIIIPLHPKVRLSFSGLRDIARQLLQAIHSFQDAISGPGTSRPIMFETRILQSNAYIESVLLNAENISVDKAAALTQLEPMPRYLGVVTVQGDQWGPIDFLVDTTSTERNVDCIGVLAKDVTSSQTGAIAKFLSTEFECGLI